VSRRRAVVAALLALLAPGLGHAYLRAWVRAVSWFLLAVAAVVIVLPESTFGAVESGGIEAAIEASASLPSTVYLASLTVRVANALDAWLFALRDPTAEESGSEGVADCPQCGGDLDEDLDFCPWCTTRLGVEE
jgi:hypothetical protein